MHPLFRPAGVAAAVAAVALGALAMPAGAGANQNLHGTFRETAAGAGLGYDIAGSAKLTVSADGTTAKVNVSGLDPTKHYGSHLHNQPCATGGGGHYQNAEGGAATPPNELWLSSSNNALGTLDPNPGGSAHGVGSATWVARLNSATQTNARSIVVHEPGTGTRIACADLE
jgi:Cu-Zn family superoxide dismutase